MEQATQVTLSGLSDVGLVRSNNEDALVVADARTGDPIVCRTSQVIGCSDRPLLLAVADGMGGANAGEIASQLALDSLCRTLARLLVRSEVLPALREAVLHANGVVVEAAAAPGYRGMGTTLVAAVVHREELLVASVGDSRAYMLRMGQLVQITKDQTFVQELVDRGSIRPEDAAKSPHKNVVLQAIGRAPTLTVPIVRINLRRDDLLLLCTDGLTGGVGDDVICGITQKKPLEDACAELIRAANASGGQDNSTVVVASFSGSSLPGPVAADLEALRAWSAC